jgi:hypothetical protein
MQHSTTGAGGGGVGGGKAKGMKAAENGPGKGKNGKRRMTLRSGRAVLGDLSNRVGSQQGIVSEVGKGKLLSACQCPCVQSLEPHPLMLSHPQYRSTGQRKCWCDQEN